MGKKGSSKDMLKEPHIKRWYDNVGRGSITTTDVYLIQLKRFCKQMDNCRGGVWIVQKNWQWSKTGYTLMDFIHKEEARDKLWDMVTDSALKPPFPWKQNI